jgi:hypothetical protein
VGLHPVALPPVTLPTLGLPACDPPAVHTISTPALPLPLSLPVFSGLLGHGGDASCAPPVAAPVPAPVPAAPAPSLGDVFAWHLADAPVSAPSFGAGVCAPGLPSVSTPAPSSGMGQGNTLDLRDLLGVHASGAAGSPSCAGSPPPAGTPSPSAGTSVSHGALDLDHALSKAFDSGCAPAAPAAAPAPHASACVASPPPAPVIAPCVAPAAPAHAAPALPINLALNSHGSGSGLTVDLHKSTPGYDGGC